VSAAVWADHRLQPRDEHGRFAEGEGSSASKGGERGPPGGATEAAKYFKDSASRDDRIREYLDYGYLDANDYMRKGAEAFEKEHGPKAAEAMGAYVKKLNADLTKAPNKTATVHRITAMDPKAVAAMAKGGELKTEAPWFVTEDKAKIDKLKETGFDKGAGTPVHFTIEDHPVSISEVGRKRPGEALIPAGTKLKVSDLREEGGILHATLKYEKAS